jgi:nucleotide-binding universal stress UspA family protein
MDIGHIVVATDESAAGRQAVGIALAIARSAEAKVTLLRVMEVGATPVLPGHAPDAAAGLMVDRRTVTGVAGIEIPRFADEVRADLLVLGRKSRSLATRLLLGDTADAVARRSRVPCLFVPTTARRFDRVLAAVDGSARGMAVLRAACTFTHAVDGRLQVVTVEAGRLEPAELAAAIPLARSERLRNMAQGFLREAGLIEAECSETGHKPQVEVRRGDPTTEILAAARDAETDVLMVGYHRGGPPGILDAGSTARRLTHSAPCIVLTIPL